MTWFENICGDWCARERTIAARLAEDYVNDPHATIELYERRLDQAIARFGRRVF